jgi:hypothetical protein
VQVLAHDSEHPASGASPTQNGVLPEHVDDEET